MHRPHALAALTLAAGLAAAASAQVVVGPVVNPANGHRYYRLDATDYTGAVAAAHAMHGQLATIPDAETNAWIYANIAAVAPRQAQYRIGLTDAAAEGSYTWSGGDPVTYTNWSPGEPNNQSNEDSAAMILATGKWNDVPLALWYEPIVEVDGPIRVPAEYPTISAAIEAAVDGQTILVAPGTYTETVDMGYKHLVIKSEGGASVTTLRATSALAGVIMGGGQGPESVFEGFTVVPDVWTQWLVFIDSKAVLRGCRISGAGNHGVVAATSTTVSDCILAGNGFGGIDAYAFYQPVTVNVQNCTIAGNGWAGVFAEATTPQWAAVVNLSNSIVQFNGAATGLIGPGAVRTSRCNIQGGAAGPGNFDADPRFAGAPGPSGFRAGDDYSLLPGSPCIDAGDNTLRAVLAGVSIPMDASGAARFTDDPSTMDSGAGPGAVIDLGACEFQGTSCPTDFNHDGFVDFFDYDDFVAAFEGGC